MLYIILGQRVVSEGRHGGHFKINTNQHPVAMQAVYLSAPGISHEAATNNNGYEKRQMAVDGGGVVGY